MNVTKQLLQAHNACDSQVDIFAAEWPEGVDITEEVLRRALALDLNLDWAAWHLLPEPARKAYEEATAPARKAYEEAKAPAWKAYEEARDLAWKAYEEAKASAWKAYEEAKIAAFLAAATMEVP